jgi:hypothetical protein
MHTYIHTYIHTYNAALALNAQSQGNWISDRCVLIGAIVHAIRALTVEELGLWVADAIQAQAANPVRGHLQLSQSSKDRQVMAVLPRMALVCICFERR